MKLVVCTAVAIAVCLSIVVWRSTSALAQKTEDVGVLDQQILHLYRTRKYAQAIELAERVVTIKEALGSDHLDFGTALNNLAALYQRQGRYAEAEPLYKRSLAISDMALGKDHLNVDASLNSLAALYEAQGRYAEAEPLYKRGLAIRDKALGKDHPDVATSLNSLADLYRAQGRYAEAEPLYKRSLAILERALGTNHPRVGTLLNNLALLYDSQARFVEAEPLFERALSLAEETSGPKHHNVGVALSNLAGLYTRQARYVDAELFYKRSLAVLINARGPDHPDVAASYNHLAELYRNQGRYAEAEPLYKRALAIRQKALGPDHYSVNSTINNLALLYQEQGRYAEAETLFKRAISIDEKILGPHHSLVAASLSNLAGLYKDRGQHAKAEPLLKRAARNYEKTLGPLHPDVGVVINNLAELYAFQNRYAEAEPLFKRSLSIAEQALGRAHPSVATILNNLAMVYEGQGRYEKAEPSLRRSLTIRQSVLGPQHPLVGQSLNNLGALYYGQGRHGKAIPLYKRGLTIYEQVLGPEHPNVRGSLNELANLYSELGHKVEEAAIRLRLSRMPPKGTRHLPLYFITNRTFGGEQWFTTVRSHKLTLGRVLMRVSTNEVKNRANRIGKSLGRIENSRLGQLTEAQTLELVGMHLLLKPKVFASSALAGQRRAAIFKNQALVFVHGYNSTFQNAMQRAAQVSFDLQFDGIVMPFTWPSQGTVRGYLTDNTMAMKSVDALATFLDQMRDVMPSVKVHLLAHSMGSQVMLRALCKIAQRKDNGKAGRHNFGQVIAAHADVSQDDFETLTKCFKSSVQGITLYINEKDTALRLRCGGFRCRAGNRARTYASADAIDTTAMGKGFWRTLTKGFDHDVFVRNSLLFGDIARLLLSGRRPVHQRTPEFRPLKDGVGQVYWAYEKSFDPVARWSALSLKQAQ